MKKYKKSKKYNEFVFFSAGPVGDHALLIDFANRFYESTETPSIIIMKHPNSFLRDMAIPYYGHISYIDFPKIKGIMEMFSLAITSIWKKRCYVLVLAIPSPLYFKLFAYFIRFCTVSRFVGFNLEGSRNFPFGKGSSYFLGKKNYIPANVDKELFYEQANRMLAFLGYEKISRLPELLFIDNLSFLHNSKLVHGEYLVVHMCSSHTDRSFPVDKWQSILKEINMKLPGVTIVCTGSPKDRVFIEEALFFVDSQSVRIFCGISLQDLLTVHAHARLNVTVHTGNAMLINMLHVPTVTINIKGIHMFKYYYNEKGTEIVSTEGCTCDPYERQCTMVIYNNVEYMSCLFNIPLEKVVETIIKKY